MILRIKSENVKELRDFYEYCYDPKSMNHLRNQIRNKMKRREEQKMKKDVNPRYLKTLTRESIQSKQNSMVSFRRLG